MTDQSAGNGSADFSSLLDRLRMQSSTAQSPGASSGTGFQQQSNGQSLPSPHGAHVPQSYYPFQLQQHPQPASNLYQGYPQQYAPLHSPQVIGTQNPFANTMSIQPSPSSSTTPTADTSNVDRSTRLLNLLNFNSNQASPTHTPLSNQPQTQITHPPAPQRVNSGGHQGLQPGPIPGSHERTTSASELVASLLGNKQGASAIGRTISPPKESESVEKKSSTSGATSQDFLLQLFNNPKPPQAETSPPSIPQEVAPSKQESAVQSEPKKANSGLFNYVNPFEQLAASSPRNQTPKYGTPKQTSSDVSDFNGPSPGAAVNGNKSSTSMKAPSSPAPQILLRRQPNGASEASPIPSPLADGRTQLEALMGIGATKKTGENVTNVLAVGGEKVGKDVEQVSTKAERDRGLATTNASSSKAEVKKLEKEVEKQLHLAALDIQKELNKKENKGALEDNLPAPTAAAVKELIAEAAEGNVGDSWESADAEDSPNQIDDGERVVKVYNFQMKPFSSITLLPEWDTKSVFREDSVMDIARLKKTFDQIDRTLATATKNYIVYAMSKNSGLRIISQDDGRDKTAFKDHNDRFFNVAVSTAKSSSYEAVLGTGVSGTVYWSKISERDGEIFEGDIADQGFAFPPTATQEDNNTSGGQLKTRVKKSSRHPKFFAVGRGKSIFIVFPDIAMSKAYLKDNKDRVIDSEKYILEQCLKINTGKAGKDFTFSEDDTTIVSLDKAGRLRIWDVRELVDIPETASSGSFPKRSPIEVKIPLMTLLTASGTDKCWPTSVQFVDKSRSFARGVALRYVIVGLKQNHTLQLWDLSLGKAVQEIHFPHEKESDAICSVVYHAPSGILIVGHPTRNSIYFVQLSAPKYNLSQMTQAEFISRLARKDPDLPKPESTAIMISLREYSFATKGQLRSLDILPSSSSAIEDAEIADPTLFELYCMHSKGVTCLQINKSDIGWSKDNKVMHPVDAEKSGFAEFGPVSPPAPSTATSLPETDVNGTPSSSTKPATASASKSKDSKRDNASTSRPSLPHTESSLLSSLERIDPKSDASKSGALNGSQTLPASDKKKKRAVPDEISARGSDSPAEVSKSIANKENIRSVQKAKHTQTKVPSESGGAIKSLANAPGTDDTSMNIGNSGDFLDKEFKRLEKVISAEFVTHLQAQNAMLYRRIEEDKRITQSQSDAKQDAILRLISSTLAENVEKSLARIVSTNIQQQVLPTLVDMTSNIFERRVGEVIKSQLTTIMPKELKGALPDAIKKGVSNPEVLKVISSKVSDQVSERISKNVETQFSSTLSTSITSTLRKLVLETSTKASGDIERRFAEFQQLAEIKSREDARSNAELAAHVKSLTETVQSMAAAQSTFQAHYLEMAKQLAEMKRQTPLSNADSKQVPRPQSVTRSTIAPSQKSAAQLEKEAIERLMTEGRYDEGTLAVRDLPHNVFRSIR
jgi:hypothetical protein